MFTHLSKPLIIILIILALIGGATYWGYQKMSPYLSLASSIVTPVVPISVSQKPSQPIRLGNICAADETKSDGDQVTPNLSEDLSKAYVMMDSFGVANLDMMNAWSKYYESLSQEAQLTEGAKSIRVIPIPNVAYTSTVFGAMGLMFSCSATDESGQTPCIEVNLGESLQTKTQLDATTGHYIREVINEKSRTTGETLVLEGTLGDPGNMIIRSTEKDGKPSNITTTRDATGRESYTIESSRLTANMTESADCSGTAEIQTREDDGETLDISMKWSLSGGKTTGTLTSKSTEPLLNTTFSW